MRLSPTPPRPGILLSALLCLSLLFGTAGTGCRGPASGPGSTGAGTPLQVAPDTYAQMVATFYAGVLAYQTSGKVSDFVTTTQSYLVRATELVPEEPAAWANLGLFQFTQLNRPEEARRSLEKALRLAPATGPGRSFIEMQLGHLESTQLRTPGAIEHFRKAIEADPSNIRAWYALAQEWKRQSGPDAEKEMVAALDRFLQVQPDNLVVLIERAQSAARGNDAETTRQLVERIGTYAPFWKPDAQAKFREAQQAVRGPDVRAAWARITQVGFLTRRTAAYQSALAELDLKQPFQQFMRLPNPSPEPAPPDMELTLRANPLDVPGSNRWTHCQTVTLVPELAEWIANEFRQKQPQVRPQKETGLFAVLASGTQVRIQPLAGNIPAMTLAFPGGASASPPGPDSIVALDFSDDFKMDLACAGAGGLRLYRQQFNTASQISRFEDVTPQSRLPATVLNTPLAGLWAVDYEADGDLDLIVAPVRGAPFVARNNGDGTWNVVTPFAGAQNVRGFAWGDVNAHGDPDAAFVDAQGRLTVFENMRAGNFRAWDPPQAEGRCLAVSVADANRDGVLDFIALYSGGNIRRISRNSSDTAWEVTELTQWSEAPEDGTARLYWADLDNNGGLDLIGTAGTRSAVWLSDTQGALRALPSLPAVYRLRVATTPDNGRLHLFGVDASGRAVRLVNTGTKNYHWQNIRPRARPGDGDDRINSFGIGGEMELRAGLLYVKQPITGPTMHFGLGENTQTAAVRIIWPNGYPRSEFPDAENGQMQADQTILAPYRLGGSCPWLFAWNGQKMGFVTDCIWRSPLGLRINAQDTAGIEQTEDWVRIRGDQLAPRDGQYDLRICAELWETHFFDHLALMAVDHPEGTEVFVDERFAVPPPPLAVIATTPVRPVLRAVDDLGNDVTAIVQKRDGQHLDTFGRGQYQGVTRDHYVQVQIGTDAPANRPLYLIATGWIHPTDSSINVAISQGSHAPPRGLSLEVPDGRGGWRTAGPGLGFPAGKIKTVVLNLTGLFRPGVPRQLRLRTNLEIYWDFIGYATGLPDTPLQKHRLALSTATLRYRGFSAPIQGDTSTPETAEYDALAGTEQSWLDLEGYYTRHGDVRPLLEKVDDRYVIMNAGDELALRFPALPPPPSGWVRDFVLIGDGWVKDGNFNTTFSRTVLPLPYHGQKAYNTPPTELENDPVYRRFPKDWEEYHTRYVAPNRFLNAMKPPRTLSAPR
ncbi:MAG: FG-GAP-like repeat-containing protein [Chloroherpetonaceae bacterium]|nr:FG-GAP-like repeat-containing protein [Chthonomonadaceae bacterium]MDW8207104.1 FG-GAP-like repeat-containing protein [Chloroherpetonaceae bacterium]